jgi:hypothetical protein
MRLHSPPYTIAIFVEAVELVFLQNRKGGR